MLLLASEDEVIKCQFHRTTTVKFRGQVVTLVTFCKILGVNYLPPPLPA